MKNLKKVCGIFLAIALTSCTNMNSRRVLNNIENIFSESRNNGEVIEIGTNIEFPEKTEEKIEEKDKNKILTNSNLKTYLEEIKDRLKNTQKREVFENRLSYEVLVGEYLVLNIDNENDVKILTSPINTTPRVKISEGKLYFRTIYKGSYTLALYKDEHLAKKIIIRAISKNNFSEQNIYDIILENSSENNELLKDAITLYKIYYPNGKNYKNVSYELLKYGYANKDNRIINEALEVLKSDINFFDDSKKQLILVGASLTNKKMFIPSSLYSTENLELKEALTAYIKSKDILDKKDKIFLENNFSDTLGIKNSESEKFKEAIINKKNDFLDSKKNALYKIEVKNYKKELSKENSKEKKAEIYYNLMEQYIKTGDRMKALRYLSLIKQMDPNSDLSKKAELEIKKMK